MSCDLKATIEEIKARVPVSEIVGRSVKLTRAGQEFKGLSPFKNEKSPSFTVNDEKRFYHCFSTGKHGDVLTWMQEVEGLDFMDAVRALAERAGVALPDRDPAAAARQARARTLTDWMEYAHRHFRRALTGSAGAKAREYLEARGLTPDECQLYGIGYAPKSRTELRDELTAAGAPVADLVECGLLIAPDNGEPYARFRDRITFPIHDPRGRLVGFGGRAMAANAKAKYINSPSTPIFDKGRTLFRYPDAKRAAIDARTGARGLIIAEGYFDAIAFARAGLQHAAAPMGTAITADQLALAWQAGGEPVLCLDGDDAGNAAAIKAAKLALPLIEPGRTVRFCFMPAGRDPDDVMREDGETALRAMASKTSSLAAVLWEHELMAAPVDDPDRVADFKNRLRALVKSIKNAELRKEYAQDFHRRLQEHFAPQRTGKAANRAPAPSSAPQSHPLMHLAQMCLGAAIEFPQIRDREHETLAALPMGPLSALRDALLGVSPECDSLKTRIELIKAGFNDQTLGLDAKRPAINAEFRVEGMTDDQRLERWRIVAAALTERASRITAAAERRERMTEKLAQADTAGFRETATR